jgi:hypothetical protein
MIEVRIRMMVIYFMHVNQRLRRKMIYGMLIVGVVII